MFKKIPSIFPILVTERLTLRQPLDSDVQKMFLLRSNTLVNRYLKRQPTETIEEVLAFIIKVNEQFSIKAGLYWAIALKENGTLIGTICLFNFSNELKKCAIGYELLPGFQGQGMMTEAMSTIIQLAFQTLGLKQAEAFTHIDNKSSIKLLRKFNFKETTSIDDVPPNHILFCLSNPDNDINPVG